ncbi:hypothetical protein HPP05_08430 [Corallococcus exiguus]|uniref:hypothetical protein n=1 Tax=Corallococcus exiguus TaxID=83462 RepID=UPI001494A663|nr:hypothetical protein [Corallococcus exiguus]NPC69772.1 hypothetical protein [Corallococcus exiguus]
MNPRKTSSPRAVCLLTIPVLLLMGMGCAAQRQQVALEDEVREHVYRKQLADVWPTALALLKDKGFSVIADPTRYEARTEWAQITPPSSLGTHYASFFLVGAERGSGQCTIRYYRNERSIALAPSRSGQSEPRPEYQPDGIQGSRLVPANRDRDLEWQLLQRLEPDFARTLAAKP